MTSQWYCDDWLLWYTDVFWLEVKVNFEKFPCTCYLHLAITWYLFCKIAIYAHFILVSFYMAVFIPALRVRWLLGVYLPAILLWSNTIVVKTVQLDSMSITLNNISVLFRCNFFTWHHSFYFDPNYFIKLPCVLSLLQSFYHWIPTDKTTHLFVRP